MRNFVKILRTCILVFRATSIAFRQEKCCNCTTFISRIKERCEERYVKLGEALALHQFFRDIDDEEAWIREKKLLVSSEDFGRDLVSVQNLKKKHKRLESEIAAHEPAINQIQEAGSFNTKLSFEFELTKELQYYTLYYCTDIISTSV